MVHFFSKVDKMNNDVVQQRFSYFERGDKIKRLCGDNGFIVHDSLLAYIGRMISFVYCSSIVLVFLSYFPVCLPVCLSVSFTFDKGAMRLPAFACLSVCLLTR